MYNVKMKYTFCTVTSPFTLQTMKENKIETKYNYNVLKTNGI